MILFFLLMVESLFFFFWLFSPSKLPLMKNVFLIFFERLVKYLFFAGGFFLVKFHLRKYWSELFVVFGRIIVLAVFPIIRCFELLIYSYIYIYTKLVVYSAF